mmetsp:Transcript_37061/g.66730  ORF Transcript_37061/g.66730 Transcript_37061/m.66730 type:complete len:240 (+) Transcript_37061:134-853(+)
MKTSTLFPLLSLVLAPTISSSQSHEPPPQLQNIEPPSKIDQDDLASPGHQTDRDLYTMETIDMDQEPCMSMPVVVEEIVDDDDDYTDTDYLTFPPTQRPTAPPTTQPPTQSPNVWGDDGHDDKASSDFEKIESIDDSSDTASSSSSSSTHSTKSSKSTKSGKSSKNSKSSNSGKSGKSGSRSQESRDSYNEGASSGGLNKVSGMIQYAEAINAAPVMGPIVFVSKYMSGVFVSAVIFAF